ncbi:outer membrane protein (porin) [Caldimonas brevitalea]|uniref:Outer membrane protein (Porin) n=1 Tax=Caldimonas brevitalea TaxID=413882 RepID=A0A0G3BZN1_9BURK|nr:outer membrane protein (porin) [Caldimonas brevitalea]
MSLAAFSGGAQAQTDVSFHGVLDFSYGRFEPSGTIREHRYNSNSMTATHVGMTAKHGFDGGWTPGVTLETFVRLEKLRTGRTNDDPFFSRNAYAFLGSDYGTLRLGRQLTPLFDSTTRFNALANSVSFSPAVRHLFGSGALEGAQGDFYWNRAVGYVSPNLDGLVANVMYARGPSELKGDYSGGSLVYSRGLWAVSLAAQDVRVRDDIDDGIDEQVWQLGAAYNFGFAKLFGLYTQTRDRELEVRSKIASTGLSVPVGPGSVLAQVAYTTAEGPAVDRKHTTTSAAYLYAYSSLTDLYVVGMDDRVRGQTKGQSVALGVRTRF